MSDERRSAATGHRRRRAHQEAMPDEATPNPAPAPAPGPEPTPAPASQAPASGAEDIAPATAEDLAAEALAAAQAAISELGTTASSTAGGDKSSAPAPAPGAAPAAAKPAPAPLPEGAAPFNFTPFDSKGGKDIPDNISLLSDVHLNVKIELGRTRMIVEDVLKLGEGCVVELDKLAGDPVDVYVNDRHVARGEVLVVNDNFCVRINEILALTAIEPPAARGAA
jgi:flagellar motor switch protein FliN/FliY